MEMPPSSVVGVRLTSSSGSSSGSGAGVGAGPVAAVASGAPVDLNKLHAAAMRARMLGDGAKLAAIEAQIEAAQAAQRTSQIESLAAVAMASGPARDRPAALTAGAQAHMTAPEAAAARGTGEGYQPAHKKRRVDDGSGAPGGGGSRGGRGRRRQGPACGGHLRIR
jgi:hypothetical protein